MTADMSADYILPPELLHAIQHVYVPANLQVTREPEREGGKKGLEYGACRFALNDAEIVFRIAKTTPKKTGQFVTVWKPDRGRNNFHLIDWSYIGVSWCG